jgi:hypothetical protein
MFEKKVLNPGSILGGKLAMGEIVVKPKFSVGVFC